MEGVLSELKAKAPILPKSCVRCGCSVDVLMTCGLCGGLVIRINHDRIRHNADDLKTGSLGGNSIATFDRQCVGKPHEFVEVK